MPTRAGASLLGRKLYFLGLACRPGLTLTRECKAHLDHLAETTRETAQLWMLNCAKYLVTVPLAPAVIKISKGLENSVNYMPLVGICSMSPWLVTTIRML
jgi:hypothetical protein